MLFITNRILKASAENSRNRLQFDLSHNAPLHEVHFCRRHQENYYESMAPDSFLNAISDCDSQQLLLYIHGFNNLPEVDIFPQTLLLQKLCDQQSLGSIRVLPLIWPCDNDLGVIKDYWDDQKSADMSGFAFARLLEFFISWRQELAAEACTKSINVLAHSMGARVFREALRIWQKYDRPQIPQFFRNTFLIAADVVNESLEYHQAGKFISDASRNVSVYFAADDLALRASKVINLKNNIASRRLGHTGPENLERIPNNIYAFDCDNFNNIYDDPMGHNYFLTQNIANPKSKPGIVFKHLFHSLSTGRVPHAPRIKHILS